MKITKDVQLTDEDSLSSDSVIEKVNESLEKIDNAKSKYEKEHYLLEMLHYLVTSSQEIAQNGDFYEAGGRLFSAAYYLEEFYPQEANDLYCHVNEFYQTYLAQKLRDGAIGEAANVAIKIANIAHEKLKDPVVEKEFVEKAIIFIQNQVEILSGVGTVPELSAKYQMLSALYIRISKWQDVLDSSKQALELAKEIKEYSIIANAYNDMASALERLQSPEKGQNVLFEAMDYFSKEASFYEQSEDFLPLSQLYQIIKNIYVDLRDPKRFQLYSRKEAAMYIALAKVGIVNNNSNTQIASYYRGAALCYRETKQNDLDAATCFFLAGDYYVEAKKFVEASINYQDSATIFEHLQRYRKSYELYLRAGENAIKAKNLEIAIENFMQAYDMTEKDNIDARKIGNLLIKNLLQLAHIQEIAQNFFVAGTLYLEAAFYIDRTPKATDDTVSEYLESSFRNYYQAATSAGETGLKSSIAYSYTLAGICAAY